MKARVILHEDGYTQFVKSLEVDRVSVEQNGKLTLTTHEYGLVDFDADEWNRLEVDK